MDILKSMLEITCLYAMPIFMVMSAIPSFSVINSRNELIESWFIKDLENLHLINYGNAYFLMPRL